jgi:3-deoxy-7-phosphoheptulonate synthase
MPNACRAAGKYQHRLEIVMRTYFEKPRTVVGWKGLISDPDLNGSYRVNHGIELARKLLLQVNELGVPTATEFLDMVTGQFIADLISWGAIGARTTESQIHREMASALSCPVGFKNGTDGNTRIAVDAIRAARASHMFLSPDKKGQMTIYQTSGNPYGHIIMRGGKSRIIMQKISPPPVKRWPNLICRNIWWWISATATARSSIAASWTSAMNLPADPQRLNRRCRDHGGELPERRHAENRCWPAYGLRPVDHRSVPELGRQRAAAGETGGCGGLSLLMLFPSPLPVGEGRVRAPDRTFPSNLIPSQIFHKNACREFAVY